tara:strand:- start:406 stop:693 length:288 start_codon:yes stop_codon:yes gene_type:complete
MTDEEKVIIKKYMDIVREQVLDEYGVAIYRKDVSEIPKMLNNLKTLLSSVIETFNDDNRITESVYQFNKETGRFKYSRASTTLLLDTTFTNLIES